MNYDVMLIHPPAVYDFRKKDLYPGPLGATEGQVQLTKVAIGVLSIAEYLDRHGYKVIINNIADRMVNDKEFNVEEHIKNVSAKVFAIGLHWHHHAQGAIEIAKLCKKLHPESTVILGGLTATYFHEEIIRKFSFIDAVIRGEAEKPFLELLNAYGNGEEITNIPNLTCRNNMGEIVVTQLMKPSDNLDEFEFTRLDLIEPKSSLYSQDTELRGSLVLCRGCVYNCTICGGSAYSYKTYLGMEKPSFRSPSKIVEDIKKLNSQGISVIGLYQDPRMGGEKYCKELSSALRKEKLNIDRLTIDIFSPVDEEFIKEFATIQTQVVFYLCPDSGNYCVRKAQGRCYSNEELLKSIKLCYKYHIPVTTFFSIGLSGETSDTLKETLELCNELFKIEQSAILKGVFGNKGERIPLGGPIVSYVFLDPASLAYDYPDKYDYRLIFNDLEQYIEGRSSPYWQQWLNYETISLNKNKIVELIYRAMEYSIDQRESFGIYNHIEAMNNRLQLMTDMKVRESTL